MAASLGMKISRVTTCHNWLGQGSKMKFYARLDKFFLNRFDEVIAVSDSVKQEILRNNISPEKVSTIYNGIDIDRFNNQEKACSIRREFGINESCKVIGSVARLSKEKGHVCLLQSAEKILQKYPDVVFLIVGDGPLRQHLEIKSSEFAKRMHAKGDSSKAPLIFARVRSDMPTIYSLMDIFALPSLTEGLPIALLEAMASQRPVVATEVGAVPKVIKHGRSGLLVQPSDVQALAKSIIELLENPQKGQYLAKNAHEVVKKRFSSQGMAEKYKQVYRKVLGETR